LASQGAESKKVKKQKEKPLPLVCCHSQIEYRRCPSTLVQPGDHVLELGSQLNDVTSALLSAAGGEGQIVAVDVSRKQARTDGKSVRQAGRLGGFRSGDELDGVDFVEVPSLSDPGEILAAASRLRAPPTVAFIDLGPSLGNDMLLETVALVQMAASLFRGSLRGIVVKSREVTLLADELVHAQTAEREAGRCESRVLGAPGAVRVVCGLGVHEYRQTIPSVVLPGDRVLEIGCHSGFTTNLLAAAVGGTGKVIGVDIGESVIDLARSQYPHVRFEVADAWDTAGLQGLGTWDVIYLDVGGVSSGDGLLTGLALTRQLRAAFPSLRAVVVKSKCMQVFGRQMVRANKLQGTDTHLRK